MNNNQNTYSLESLAQMKAEKIAELEQTKHQIAKLAHDIITPPPIKNNMELWMHYASSGMTAYKSLITCVKFIQRLRGTFSKKNKRKSIFS